MKLVPESKEQSLTQKKARFNVGNDVILSAKSKNFTQWRNYGGMGGMCPRVPLHMKFVKAPKNKLALLGAPSEKLVPPPGAPHSRLPSYATDFTLKKANFCLFFTRNAFCIPKRAQFHL